MQVVVIGGGASGFFAAISCAKANPDAEITLLEKSGKLLSKVLISGGGRCNVTHACYEDYNLVKNYPRGSHELKKMLPQFSVKDTIAFFEARGVKIKAEKDGRMFPVTDRSQSIVDCLVKEARVLGVKILTELGVKAIEKSGARFIVRLRNGSAILCDRVVVATGGNPNNESYEWLRDLGHDVVAPVPSLFTFNVPDMRLNGLQGVAVTNAFVKIAGTELGQRGPVLITHWGFSGPAVLKLSAWAARALYDMNYLFNFIISWLPDVSEEPLRELLLKYKLDNPKKSPHSNPMFELPKRLWERLLLLAGVEEDFKWGTVTVKNINKLIEELIRGNYTAKGKTTYKEEFVTSGGISLTDVNLATMESKKCQGLFFAGELLNLDGITGGFNFQAAWTTGWIAGKHATLPNL